MTKRSGGDGQSGAGGWWARFLAALVAVGLVAAGVAGEQRWRVERANRTVDVVFDYEGAKELAAVEGLAVADVLRQLKDAGATAAAVSERTLGDLSRSGDVEVVSGQAILDAYRLGGRLDRRWEGLLRDGLVDPRATYVAPAQGPDASDRLGREFWRELPARLKSAGVSVAVMPAGAAGGPVYQVSADTAGILEMGAGFDNAVVEQVARAGLGVALRPQNVPGADPTLIRSLFAGLPTARYSEAIFAGEEVLGYPDNLKVTAEALRERGLTFGIVEFAKQKGEKALAALAGYQTVRVHSITKRELPGMARPVAVERMLLAARERDMRALYLRPLPTAPALSGAGEGTGSSGASQGAGAAAGPGALSFNLEYVREVAGGLERQGFGTGSARPFAPIGAAVLLPALMALGVAAAGLYLIDRLAARWRRRFARSIQTALLFVAVVGTEALYLKGYTVLVRQLWALGAAMVFPTAAVWFTLLEPRTSGSRRLSLAALGRLWLAAAISYAGSLYVVGFLADTRFLLKVEEFAGVKLMHLIPLAAVALLAVMVWLRDNPATRPSRLLVAAWRYPLQVGHVLIAVVALLGLAVYVLRTGNQSILPVSGLERSARSFLETALVVRPRTKEFLLGHPAFILAPLLFRDRRWASWAIALALATIGQLSMVNTFTHVHTPMVISAWRGANGLILGSIVGLAAAWVYERFLARLGSGRGETPTEADEGGSAG